MLANQGYGFKQRTHHWAEPKPKRTIELNCSGAAFVIKPYWTTSDKGFQILLSHHPLLFGRFKILNPGVE
jgi:hypothetical protein